MADMFIRASRRQALLRQRMLLDMTNSTGVYPKLIVFGLAPLKMVRLKFKPLGNMENGGVITIGMTRERRCRSTNSVARRQRPVVFCPKT
jgi:hypothetical protein